MLDLLAEAAAWTRARGFGNWPERFPRGLIERNHDRAELYVAERDDRPVATLALQWSDDFFWGTDDGTAGYIHRLAVRRTCAGDGLGYRLIEWAADRTRERGRTALRLDVVSTNRPLRDYYERAGFAHVRDLTGAFTHADGTRTPWRTSLYERVCSSR